MPIFNARRNRHLYLWHVSNQISYVFNICLRIFLWLDTFQFSVVQQPCVGKKTIKKKFQSFSQILQGKAHVSQTYFYHTFSVSRKPFGSFMKGFLILTYSIIPEIGSIKSRLQLIQYQWSGNLLNRYCYIKKYKKSHTCNQGNKIINLQKEHGITIKYNFFSSAPKLKIYVAFFNRLLLILKSDILKCVTLITYSDNEDTLKVFKDYKNNQKSI